MKTGQRINYEVVYVQILFWSKLLKIEIIATTQNKSQTQNKETYRSQHLLQLMLHRFHNVNSVVSNSCLLRFRQSSLKEVL